MSSENYTLNENFYTSNDKIIPLLKTMIFDAEEMMEEATDETEHRWFKHAIRVLKYELRYWRKMLKRETRQEVFVQDDIFVQN